MSQLQKELSYFQLRLLELLNTSFPEKATDEQFIAQRCELAASTYEDSFRAGYPIEECNAIANQALFEGLHFSLFDAIFQVVCHEFDTLMSDEELRPFAF